MRLVSIASLLVIGGCNDVKQPSNLAEVLDTGVLKVGTTYGLTNYYNGPSGPVGFEYELADGFANYLGVKLEVFPFYNLSELFPQLANNHINLVAAGITVSPERAQTFTFGPAYQQASEKLVFKQGKEWPRKIEDLNGELVVIADSSHHESLLKVKQNYTQLSWQQTEDKDVEELLEMVLNEDLDYTVADSNILALMRRRHPELAIGFSVSPEQNIAWAVNKNQDDSLLAALIEYFGIIQSNGTLAALEDKYFGHVRNFNYVDTREFIKSVRDILPKFKPWFEQYSGDLDWRLLAAMSYQESHWKPNAKSVTGVRGLMMLTLATAKDMGIKSRLDPEQSIKGGSTYLASILRRIPARIQPPDSTWFALAAYNIGLGHLEDARVLTDRQGGNPDMWVDVKQRLLQLRQKRYYKTTKYGYARGNEAVAYVDNIRRYYDTLVWLDDQPPQILEEQSPSEKGAPINELQPAIENSSTSITAQN
ncbi:membrane-bound lytic murein transglycosylase MltF [Paraglaciecola algarum]|uniref:membrane-bound lytic murein transglycosylase MltF n=1 Tax=Paraglaciecola algarum TaxID=3050085 RepID=UPI0032EA2721